LRINYLLGGHDFSSEVQYRPFPSSPVKKENTGSIMASKKLPNYFVGVYAYLRALHLGLSKSHFVRLSRSLTSFVYLLSHYY
jgi:hypothetical protein